MQSAPDMPPLSHHRPHRIGQREFVLLIALLMAIVALSIDIMLPSLPNIARSFSLADPNAPQLIITIYLGGFAIGQLMWGPISDRLGRRPVLLVGLAIYIAGAGGALAAGSFPALLGLRALQGLGASAPRVISLAVVRDTYSGRQMARTMSFAMMVFMIVPILAPMLGQTLAHQGGWRATFYALLAIGLAGFAWAGTRLPETRHADAQMRARAESIAKSVRNVLSNRLTVGYMIAGGFMFGCLMSYVSSAQQIFVDIFNLGDKFPLVFGAVASVMIPATFTNSRLVVRVGMRRLSHTALAGFIAASALLCVFAIVREPPMLAFCLALATAFFCFGLITPNFNAMAMEPLSTDSGTGSSLIGFYMTGTAALISWFVGHLFDGSLVPLAFGFLACSVAAMAVVVIAEGPAHMFRASDDAANQKMTARPD